MLASGGRLPEGQRSKEGGSRNVRLITELDSSPNPSLSDITGQAGHAVLHCWRPPNHWIFQFTSTIGPLAMSFWKLQILCQISDILYFHPKFIFKLIFLTISYVSI